MVEEKLRELEESLSSTRTTALVLGTPRQRVWMWRKRVARFTDAELSTLGRYLTRRLSESVAKLEHITR